MGGAFLFDMNMEKAYPEDVGQNVGNRGESVCIVRGSYTAEQKIGRTDITAFRLLTGWKRSDAVLYQRCYASDEVSSALMHAGFTNVRLHDAEELEMEGDISVGRTFFLASR